MHYETTRAWSHPYSIASYALEERVTSRDVDSAERSFPNRAINSDHVPPRTSLTRPSARPLATTSGYEQSIKVRDLLRHSPYHPANQHRRWVSQLGPLFHYSSTSLWALVQPLDQMSYLNLSVQSARKTQLGGFRNCYTLRHICARPAEHPPAQYTLRSTR